MPGTPPALTRGLSRRHIRFIALGSAIGTGLFYGSADAIRSAGPSVLLAYLIGGAAIFIVMRALGEMAVRDPSAGSFGVYASRYLGPSWGFMTGWMYVAEMLFVVLADLTAIGVYFGLWFPGVPRWVWIVAVIAVIGAVNLLAVKVFGELEFWLSLIKVSAIIAMIVGGLVLLWLGRGAGDGVSMLWTEGGFFPHGLSGFALCFAVVMFGFGGIEIVGVTAGEADDPDRTIPMAVNSVPVRVLLFYVAALAVIMALFPWHRIGTGASPFVAIFDSLGLTVAAGVLNVIVITAALSAINADIFGAGRMIYGLATQGQAPRACLRVTERGVPYFTAFVMIGAMIVGAVLNAVVPENLFLLIASLVTFATIWVWVLILLAHYAMRRQEARGQIPRATFRTPMWPASSALALALLLGVVAMLAVDERTRPAFAVGLVVVTVLAVLHRTVIARRATVPATTPTPPQA